MPHKKPERLGGIGVITLPYDLVEQPSVHMVAKSLPYRVIIPDAEVIAGNYLAALYRGEVFYPAHLFYYQAAVCYHFIKKACAENVCDLAFYFA